MRILLFEWLLQLCVSRIYATDKENASGEKTEDIQSLSAPPCSYCGKVERDIHGISMDCFIYPHKGYFPDHESTPSAHRIHLSCLLVKVSLPGSTCRLSSFVCTDCNQASSNGCIETAFHSEIDDLIHRRDPQRAIKIWHFGFKVLPRTAHS